MLINFVFLTLCSSVLGKKYTSHIVKIFQIPAGFALKWINIFFTPSFVTLPLSDHVDVKELFIIAAVFVIGFIFMMSFISYLCIFLQKILGLSKKELDDDIELDLLLEPSEPSPESPESLSDTPPVITEPSKVFTPQNRSTPVMVIERENDEIIQQFDQLPDKSKQISIIVSTYFDWFVYAVLFIVGLPIYYACNYALPLQLSIGVIWFFIAMLISPKWRQFAHPILVSVCGVLLSYYILVIIKRDGFMEMLREYHTGRNYLTLFNTSKSTHWPGAGDVFTSLMDILIVSLSLPMFNYKDDLRKHFMVLAPPVLVSSFGSFFVYPTLCHQIGISPARSLGFVGRSVTLLLGTPLMLSLHGSVPLMAVCTIVSGIIGVLCGDIILGEKFLRIRKDDYVTRGVTLGINCGAISTAHLLNVDPRLALMSSLGFVLFGTVMVLLLAINPLSRMIQSWAGLQ